MVGFYCISSNVPVRGNVYSIIIKGFCRNFMIFSPCTYFLIDYWHMKNGTLKLHLHLRQRVKSKLFLFCALLFCDFGTLR